MGLQAEPAAASMYPHGDKEPWSQWLERIQPQVVATMRGAVLPGEQQLEAFRSHITTLGKPYQTTPRLSG